jgi:CPA2 family monovalent cation:H+ antiporter-2
VGRYIAEALRTRGVSHLVVEFDAHAASRLREAGTPVVFGDATEEAVLKHARLKHAEQVIIVLPEAASTEGALHLVRPLAPSALLVARVHRGEDIPRMREAGASHVVHGEFEAGVELIRQTLTHLTTPPQEIEDYLGEIRQHRYRQVES